MTFLNEAVPCAADGLHPCTHDLALCCGGGQVLLFCAVIVCLSGVMYESDSATTTSADQFEAQRNLITFVVMAVIVLSVVYCAYAYLQTARVVCAHAPV